MEFIYDDKRICNKTMLFIKSIILLFHFICLYVDFNSIEKKSIIFIYYINTIFSTFYCVCNNARYEYHHIKIYGQNFSSIDEFNEWRKSHKFIRITYFLNNFEMVSYIFFFCMTIKQFTFINNQIIFYSISTIILYIYACIFFLIIIFGCMCLCSFNFSLHKPSDQSRSLVYIVENVDINKECCICMDKNTNNWVHIPCGHSFHNECIIQWNRTSNTCPICRSVLLV
jgi:hypothetical protein